MKAEKSRHSYGPGRRGHRPRTGRCRGCDRECPSRRCSQRRSRAPGLDSATEPDLGLGLGLVVTVAGRGVLDGAFAVLDALAQADEGLGLTALARASGLAKTSVHRLAEQLVTLGAMQSKWTPSRGPPSGPRYCRAHTQ